MDVWIRHDECDMSRNVWFDIALNIMPLRVVIYIQIGIRPTFSFLEIWNPVSFFIKELMSKF